MENASAIGELKTHMAKSVPLRATLRVHRVTVVIRNVLCKSLDRVLECLTAKGWRLGYSERETVQVMSKASPDSGATPGFANIL